jgi:excisionase family DNA binding protein
MPVRREPIVEITVRDAQWLALAARRALEVARRDGRTIPDHALRMSADLDELASLGRAMFALPRTSREHRPGRLPAGAVDDCDGVFAAGTLTTAEVAQGLAVSNRAVQRLAQRGTLTARRGPRGLLFDNEEVERYRRMKAAG